MACKNKFGLAITTLSLLMIMPGAQAATDSATITISATVVDSTCTPDWTASVPVQLGRAAIRDFNAAGDVGASNSFELKLKDCGSGATVVKVTASGTGDDDNPGLFKNEAASGGASGVAVALFGGPEQSTQLKPGEDEAEYDITGDTAPTLTFKAELRQSGATKPTAGDVQSSATLTLTYE
jgi:type 1 fimbria pilin